MSRRVANPTSLRCPSCRLPVRWCICSAHETVECPLGADVLMHYCEANRPSSTGHLIHRVLPAARVFPAGGGRPLDRAALVRPGRDLWVLHPHGELPPPGVQPANVQVLLLDGSWKQASDLLRSIAGWGRTVRLPLAGESRFLLRAQQGPGQFSTIEALLHLLGHFGLDEAQERMRRQFELHVFAGLLARGKRAEARAFVATSPIRAAFPELLLRLDPGHAA